MNPQGFARLRCAFSAYVLPGFAALVALAVAVPGQNPACSPYAVSTEDITVAEGLQLPNFGAMWALDRWKGVPELVQLRVTHLSGPVAALSLRRRIELEGEAAKVRIHSSRLQLFRRGFSGDDTGVIPSTLAIVPLTVEGNRRVASKTAAASLKAARKGRAADPGDVIPMTQQRLGLTDWSRMGPDRALPPGEYILVSLLPVGSGANEAVYDFAVDPEAGENRRAVRSEADRPMP